jgi:hypothetical protein
MFTLLNYPTFKKSEVYLNFWTDRELTLYITYSVNN